MRKIVVLLVVMLFLVSGVSSASIVIPSPFKGVEVKVGASAGEKSGQEQVSPTYCEKKSDCEWVECGCFSKERKDEDVLCPMNTSAKECMCMHNICIPDFMAFFNSKGMNVNKYMRQSFFKPECPKFNYMFFNSLEQSETALLVLAFKDASNFDSFLVQNCGSPFLRQKIDEALGGEFFDPCNGIDFLYSGCAMYKADDCAAWTDSALAEIEWKKTSCEQTFKNCTYHQQIKEDVEKDRAKCLAAPSDYTTACASDCERILLAKDACASQKIDKLQFKQSAYGKIELVCKSRGTLLDKARRNIIDEELAIDVLDVQAKGEALREDIITYKQRKPVSYLMLRIKQLFGFAKASEADDARENVLADVEEFMDALDQLKGESDDAALNEAIDAYISELQNAMKEVEG